ncbi:MAG TPA: hypothetical protein P5186_29660 [Candidatus Paceibacterota bacterium]|nr:hypothetical protein [Candidatus Paceibacterota bacterium]HSA02252.1 hypothetical protein [Candidatus Paceibacterota bacterium]
MTRYRQALNSLLARTGARSYWTNIGLLRGYWSIGIVCGLLFLAGSLSAASPAVSSNPPAGIPHTDVGDANSSSAIPRLPRVSPDYLEVIIPPNLAPLNLVVQEQGVEYQLRVSGTRGQSIEIRQANPQVRFPLREWKKLLAVNRGGKLTWNIAVRSSAGDWTSYAPFECRIAEEDIDPYILYRRFRPLYSSYKHMGIYQRHLETFEEKPVLRNETIEHGCVNCHTFQQGSPDRFVMSFRGRFGTPTLLIDSNRVSRIDTKMGYLSWHPNGKLLVFSANAITQFFHLAGPVNRDVNDPRSDLQTFDLETRTLEKPAAIAVPDCNENWPCWAPDGRFLYYCRAPVVAFRDIPSLRYDLVRIPYDSDQKRWGEPETLVSGAENRLSAHQPRVSPDNRFLVFTASDSGSFPLFRPESDLFLLRLDTRKSERLTINSDQAETWHSWSSNGRWMVFGSRGLDGVFARLLITHVDSDARFSKPLLLPQEDPAYYDHCLDNFNVPELVRGPLQVSESDLARVVLTPGSAARPAGPDVSIPGQSSDHSTISDNPYE